MTMGASWISMLELLSFYVGFSVIFLQYVCPCCPKRFTRQSQNIVEPYI